MEESLTRHIRKIWIILPEDDRYYEIVSDFDFEAIQVPDESSVHGRDIHYIHIPATFSVCTNIPGFEEPVHVQSSGSPQELVKQLVGLQIKHQETASQIMWKKFEWLFEKLDQENPRKPKFERYCDI